MIRKAAQTLAQKYSSPIRHDSCQTAFCFLSTEGAPQAEETIQYEDARPFKEIPGPRQYPIVQSMPYFLTKVPVKMNEIHLFQKHMRDRFGPIVRLGMPMSPPFILVYDADMLDHFIKHGVGKWQTRDFAEYFGIYRKKERPELFEGVGGLLAENAEPWWDIRSKVQQPMMRPKTSHQYLPAMNSVTDDFIKRIRSIRDPGTKETPKSFQNDLYKWALESVGVVALNTRLGCLEDASSTSDGQILIDSVNKMFEIMANLEMSAKLWRFYPNKDWRDFVKEMDIITNVGMKYIRKQMEELKNKKVEDMDELSLLERFLLIPGLSKGVAAAMAMDMLFAGVDTTGNSMGFFLYHVAKNPDVQRKIQEEIGKILPDKNTPVTAEAINSMTYLKAALKESMRIHPIITALGRQVHNDIVLSGYKIPKGTTFVACIMLMCRDEKYYPEPMIFKPERWLRGHEEQHTANPRTFMPFGYGMRMCIGRRIAEQEMWILAAKILRNFWVEYHYKDMGVVTRLVNVPSEPLQFQFHDRKPV